MGPVILILVSECFSDRAQLPALEILAVLIGTSFNSAHQNAPVLLKQHRIVVLSRVNN